MKKRYALVQDREAAITYQAVSKAALQPRALGRIAVAAKAIARGSALAGLQQSGAMKALFPRPRGAALDPRLEVDLAEDARFVMVGPLLFGRLAMGEAVHAARFRDRISIRRGGVPLYRDGLGLSGDGQRGLRSARGRGAAAPPCGP